jgi:hypothetical protein
MKLPTILNDSKELLQIGIERIADSSKPAIVVYSYTFAAGFSSAMDWVVGMLPNLCMLAGFIGTVILAHANWKKSQREEIETETARIHQRIAREEMRKMEIETRKDDHQ